jgi:hypothetical protein
MNAIISQVNFRTPSSKLVSSFCPTSSSAMARPRLENDGARIAAHHIRAHEGEIFRRERIVALSRDARGFFDRHGFAGERRLIDEQILGLDQPQIGGDHVAGRKPHHIAGDETFERRFDETFVLVAGLGAAHRDMGSHHGAQFLGGFVGAMLLHEGERHAQDHYGRNDNRRPPVAQDPGDDREQQAGALFARDAVWPMPLQSPRGLGSVESIERGGKTRQHIADVARGGLAEPHDNPVVLLKTPSFGSPVHDRAFSPRPAPLAK